MRFIDRFIDGEGRFHYKGTLVSEDGALCSAEVSELVEKYAVVLIERGIGPGSIVGVAVGRGAPLYCTVYALLSINAVPVIEDVEEVLDGGQNYEWLISDNHECAHKCSSLVTIESIDNRLSSVDARAFSSVSRYSRAAQVGALMLRSSGTTGRPKTVVFSNRNLVWVAREYARLYEFNKDTVVAYCKPYHYSLSVMTGLVAAGYYGVSTVMVGTSDAVELYGMLGRHGVTIFPATPLVLRNVKESNKELHGLPSLKIIDSGGAPLPPALNASLGEALRARVVEGYGATETSSLSHFVPPHARASDYAGSVGVPCSEVECRLLDDCGVAIRGVGQGELQVRGPNVAMGVVSDGGLVSPLTDEYGWYNTGDVFWRGTNGAYYYICRVQELGGLGLGGSTTIREMRELALGLTGVHDAFVWVSASAINLMIEVSETHGLTHQEVRGVLAKTGVNEYGSVNVHIVERIPRNRTGKPQRVAQRGR